MTHLPGKFVWFEIVSDNAKKAQAFYGEVLGWKVEAYPMGDFTYEMIKAGDATIGGYAQLSKGQKPHWISYLSVPDVDKAAKTAVASGGKTLEAAQDIPTVGRMQRIADPTGAELSLFRSASGDTESETKDGEFYWNELVSPDPAKSVAFYEKVAGFVDRPMDMGPAGTYHVLEAGGKPRAGITKPQMGEPSQWLPYVKVADCDATLARARKHGGTELVPPTDIPTVGRFGVFLDPLGAAIAVIKPVDK